MRSRRLSLPDLLSLHFRFTRAQPDLAALPDCDHVYCVTCILGWAVAKADPPAPAPGIVSPGGDPHVRVTPSATGALLNLGPHETPVDRVVDLARKADAVLAEMVSRGLVKLNGTKVVYSLPGE
jgi:hypothetical protein